MRVATLEPSSLADAARVLGEACAFDRAAEVAREKLFSAGPPGVPGTSAPPGAGDGAPLGTGDGAPLGTGDGAPLRTGDGAPLGTGDGAPLDRPHALGAWDGDELVGVASVAARWLRVLAVAPRARLRGVGQALLEACEAIARDAGEPRLRALDQPGNYLAPGVDERNTDAIAWLEKRGWRRDGEPRCNVLVAVRGNPRVTPERAAELADRARASGYEVRRGRADEHELLEAVAVGFGGAWPFELARALEHEPAGVHVALKDGAYCAFAAHDGNNRGLGWFGPTGTWPEHRGRGLGEALLLACLVDVARDHDRCEIAWIGPRPFYDKAAGIVDERRFVAMLKPFR